MSKRLQIGLDMDGILAKWTQATLDIANNRWRINLKFEDIIQYNIIGLIKNELKEQYSEESFSLFKVNYDILNPPGHFLNLKPYAKVRETVLKLSKLGDVTIITKPIKWKNCPDEKVQWLNNYLKGIEYKVVMVDHPKLKGLFAVDYMVDDDPRVIESLGENTRGIMVKQPWNKQYIEDHCIYWVEKLADVPEKIKRIEYS